MARWSSGQDGGLSRRKREFDSPTGHHVGMDYIPFKKPSHSAGLFSYHFVIPPFPTKLCKANFCGGPAAGGNERPGRMDCIPFKNSGKWLGFFHTISSFLLIPKYFARQTFAGAPLPGENEHPGRMDCIPFKNSDKWLGFSRIISSFLLNPTKLCKANFCGNHIAGEKMSCFSYYSTISTSHKLRKKQRLVFI